MSDQGEYVPFMERETKRVIEKAEVYWELVDTVCSYASAVARRSGEKDARRLDIALVPHTEWARNKIQDAADVSAWSVRLTCKRVPHKGAFVWVCDRKQLPGPFDVEQWEVDAMVRFVEECEAGDY